MCSQTGSNLASLHTEEERKFIIQLVNVNATVWLGGYKKQQQIKEWFWSDDSPFRINGSTNEKLRMAGEGGTCLAMKPKSGELHGAPCGELNFYICTTTASSTSCPSSRKPAAGIVPHVRLLDVLWSYSDSLADDIFRSSSFVQDLRSGRLRRSCYSSFLQQEALYLHRVSSTLQALIGRLQEVDKVSSLLVETLKLYSSRDKSLLTSPPPQWLLSSLQSFHSVVLEEPLYWLVALSARACLRHFLDVQSLHHERSDDTVEETWTLRFMEVMEEHQHHMDVFKAVNVFRQHMINQRSFYKDLVCEEEEDKDEEWPGRL